MSALVSKARSLLVGKGPKPKILWVKILAWSVALGICARIGWAVASDGAGANPVEFLQTHTGWQAIAWLLAALFCSPASKLPGMGWLVATRRLLGLWCFAFATAHLGIYILDQGVDLADIAKDIVKRPFITAGFAGWLALVPLAATSTHKAMRWMGKRWRQLHKASYFVAFAGLLHWYWMRAPKHKLSEWSIFLALYAVWAVWRGLVYWRSRRPAVAPKR